jgi:hypothetical protein
MEGQRITVYEPRLCWGNCTCIYGCASFRDPFHVMASEALGTAIEKHFGIPLYYGDRFCRAIHSAEEGEQILQMLRNRKVEPIHFSGNDFRGEIVYQPLRFGISEEDDMTFAEMQARSTFTIYRTHSKG